ncbi:alpha-(1,3)-fucosyltransferase C-like [Dermacentor albipictus]|uniref:alpha-(1,3)-fucosyltransferase C-like n=1 Tax=Dermacentor albipictus TaxID=60249 RepID=UPI0031FE217C
MFTWTMAYRDDADIVVPYKIWRCGSATDKPLAKTIEPLTSGERKDAAWVLGSCEQYRFENQILALGTVDDPVGFRSVDADTSTGDTVSIRLFPDCGANECSSRGECIQHIAHNYHFIIVSLKPECFQSAYELIYDAFEYSVVPVVLAPANFKLNVPDHSVVSSADFPEPGELAAHLRDLRSDRAMYESYFAWKQNCTLTPPENEMCPLCRVLWETPADHLNVHPGVIEWWERRLVCQRESLHGLDSAFVLER